MKQFFDSVGSGYAIIFVDFSPCPIYTLMLLGIVSSQQLDIKEIKRSLIDIDQRLDSMEKKFDQMLSILSKLTTRPE